MCFEGRSRRAWGAWTPTRPPASRPGSAACCTSTPSAPDSLFASSATTTPFKKVLFPFNSCLFSHYIFESSKLFTQHNLSRNSPFPGDLQCNLQSTSQKFINGKCSNIFCSLTLPAFSFYTLQLVTRAIKLLLISDEIRSIVASHLFALIRIPAAQVLLPQHDQGLGLVLAELHGIGARGTGAQEPIAQHQTHRTLLVSFFFS
jgi:hypothetical protein